MEWEFPHLPDNETRFFGIRGLKLSKIPDILQEKLKELEPPEVLIIHCRSNDIGNTTDVNELIALVSSVLSKVFTLAKQH